MIEIKFGLFNSLKLQSLEKYLKILIKANKIKEAKNLLKNER